MANQLAAKSCKAWFGARDSQVAATGRSAGADRAGDGERAIRLDAPDVALDESSGLNARELNRILVIAREEREALMKALHEHFR